jgi:hypothetical protein
MDGKFLLTAILEKVAVLELRQVFKISNITLQRRVEIARLRQNFQDETTGDNSNKRPCRKEVFIEAEETDFCDTLEDGNRRDFGCTEYQIFCDEFIHLCLKPISKNSRRKNKKSKDCFSVLKSCKD